MAGRWLVGGCGRRLVAGDCCVGCALQNLALTVRMHRLHSQHACSQWARIIPRAEPLHFMPQQFMWNAHACRSAHQQNIFENINMHACALRLNRQRPMHRASRVDVHRSSTNKIRSLTTKCDIYMHTHTCT